MLRVHTERFANIAFLRFQGQIVNGVETSTLRRAVLDQEGAQTLILDLARVDLIDAGGLGVLLELREWTRSKGVEFRLMNVTRRVKQVLNLARLDSVFEISSTSDGLVEAARRNPVIVVETMACAR